MDRDPKDAARAERGQSRRFTASLAVGLAAALILRALYAGPERDLWWLFIVCPLAIYMLQVLFRPMTRR